MANFQFVLAMLLVVFAILGCEAQKQKRPVRLTQGSRKLARQEAEEPITPYPTADELKPEVPFEEAATVDEPAADEVVPGTTEVIPDEVYGPPEVAVVYSTPDEVYGPPEVDENAFARQRARKARLVQARRQAAYRKAASKKTKV